jgi:hypothetical protein
MDSDRQYLLLMLCCFLITIAIETPILLVGLSRRHPMRHRLFAGVWLTACTYPIVWLVLPQWIDAHEQRALYLAVAETFAPVAECLLFWLAFGNALPRTRQALIQDMAVVALANLASFAAGSCFDASRILDEIQRLYL